MVVQAWARTQASMSFFQRHFIHHAHEASLPGIVINVPRVFSLLLARDVSMLVTQYPALVRVLLPCPYDAEQHAWLSWPVVYQTR